MDNWLAVRHAMNFKLWECVTLITFDQHEIDRRKFGKQVGQIPFRLVAQFMEDGKALGRADDDLGCAGDSVHERVLARLVEVETVMRVLEGGHPAAARNDANKVRGCASQVWLATSIKPNGASGPVLTFAGDSDAHIVRGLIAVLFALFSGKGAKDILATDAIALFEKLGLREHLTPQRSNGFRSMVDRIRRDASTAVG